MKTAILLVVCSALATGCTIGQRKHVNRAGAVAMASLLAVDWYQTREAADDFATGRSHEVNWLLGKHPTTARIDVYNASALVGLSAIGAVLPEKLRTVYYVTAVVLQTFVVGSNTIGMSY